MADYDLCVIGGGINGTGIARDAAGRGLSVMLAEAGDLGSATSSASTKLIHGGLRYLEHYEFGLVRESLAERETLSRAAPHIVHPQEFILPHDKGQRPAWMIRLGLFLYDHLGGKKSLPASKSVDFVTHPSGDPLSLDYRMGFSYHDCWVQDARLVVLNAIDAKVRGADILTHTAAMGMEIGSDKKSWRVTLRNLRTEDDFEITARSVVNAGGPWVRAILESSGLAEGAPKIRLAKGSHVVVPKIYEGQQAYILQQPDGRIVFAIPFEYHFTLIGTTDVPYEGDPARVAIEPMEVDYLCAAVNRAFKKQTSPSDIVWTYSGVRPLLDDGKADISKVTRDYKLHMDLSHGAPLLSVFGGKLTTYRVLAEEAVDRLVPARPGWTEGAVLPGGDMPGGDFSEFVQAQIKRYNGLHAGLVYRYAASYGTRMDIFLKGVEGEADLGRHYGDGVFEAEIIYLVAHEFARTAPDIFWRRSKLGLHVTPGTVSVVEGALPELIKGIFAHE